METSHRFWTFFSFCMSLHILRLHSLSPESVNREREKLYKRKEEKGWNWISDQVFASFHFIPKLFPFSLYLHFHPSCHSPSSLHFLSSFVRSLNMQLSILFPLPHFTFKCVCFISFPPSLPHSLFVHKLPVKLLHCHSLIAIQLISIHGQGEESRELNSFSIHFLLLSPTLGSQLSYFPFSASLSILCFQSFILCFLPSFTSFIPLRKLSMTLQFLPSPTHHLLTNAKRFDNWNTLRYSRHLPFKNSPSPLSPSLPTLLFEFVSHPSQHYSRYSPEHSPSLFFLYSTLTRTKKSIWTKFSLSLSNRTWRWIEVG